MTAYEKELMISTQNLIKADTARNEGYIEIGVVYDTTAKHNKEHARIWLRQLSEGTLPTTLENLQESAEDELEMSNVVYQEFARVAREEGYDQIAGLFSGVGNIDQNQHAEFRVLAGDLALGDFFCRTKDILWVCMQCGNIMQAKCAPRICPVCGFPQGYYSEYVPTV